MTASITLTPLPDAAPAPRMQVLVDDLDVAVTTITLTRTAEGRSMDVRGAVRVAVSGGFQILDIECGFNIPSTYRAEMFAADGSSLGFTPIATDTLTADGCWVHNPLYPEGAVSIDITDESGRSLTRKTNAERFEPEGRSLAILVTGRRRGLESVDLYFETDDPVVAEGFETMIGDYNTPTVPILCVRTPPFLDIPRTFFAGVLAPSRTPVNVHMGGTLRGWTSQVDEAAPPFPGIIMPLLSRDDVDAAFASRDLLDAAYGRRLDIDRDFSKAGTA